MADIVGDIHIVVSIKTDSVTYAVIGQLQKQFGAILSVDDANGSVVPEIDCIKFARNVDGGAFDALGEYAIANPVGGSV